MKNILFIVFAFILSNSVIVQSAENEVLYSDQFADEVLTEYLSKVKKGKISKISQTVGGISYSGVCLSSMESGYMSDIFNTNLHSEDMVCMVYDMFKKPGKSNAAYERYIAVSKKSTLGNIIFTNYHNGHPVLVSVGAANLTIHRNLTDK